MHKMANEIKPKDQFLMAGGHYMILDVYDTDDEMIVKFVFNHVNAPRNKRFTMTIDRSALFITV